MAKSQVQATEAQALSTASELELMRREKIQAERTEAPDSVHLDKRSAEKYNLPNRIHMDTHLDKVSAQQPEAQEAKRRAEKAARLEEDKAALLKGEASATKVTIIAPHIGASDAITFYRNRITIPNPKEDRSAQTLYVYTSNSRRDALKKDGAAQRVDLYRFGPNSISVRYDDKQTTVDKAVKYLHKVSVVQPEIVSDNKTSSVKRGDAAIHLHDKINVKVELLPIQEEDKAKQK